MCFLLAGGILTIYFSFDAVSADFQKHIAFTAVYLAMLFN
jgi:hypothetical protein